MVKRRRWQVKRKLLTALVVAVPIVAVGGLRLSAQDKPANPECSGNVQHYVNEVAKDKDGNVIHYENGQGSIENAGYATEEEAVRVEADAGVKQYDETKKEGDRHVVKKQGRTAGVFHVSQTKIGRFYVDGGAVCYEDTKEPPRGRPQR